MPWDRVHDEAEVLEHVISEELEALIAAKLGHPTHDPHGDPIPDAGAPHRRGPHRPRSGRSSAARAACSCASRDTDPEMLRYLRERGIAPGEPFEVVDKQPFDGPVFARFGGGTHVLGGALARAMRVEVRA